MRNTTWVARTFLMKRERTLMVQGPQHQVPEYLLIRTNGRVRENQDVIVNEELLTFEHDKVRAKEACVAHDLALYNTNPELFRKYPEYDDYELMVHDRGWPTISRVECPDHPLTPKDFKP